MRASGVSQWNGSTKKVLNAVIRTLCESYTNGSGQLSIHVTRRSWSTYGTRVGVETLGVDGVFAAACRVLRMYRSTE